MPRMPFPGPYVDLRNLGLAGTPRWVLPGWTWESTTNTAIVSGRKYYTPIFVASAWTYIGIGTNVATLAAGSARLGIYNMNASGLPTTVVLDAGTVDTGSTGEKEIVISQLLRAGYYFLCLVGNATPTLVGPSSTALTVCPVSGLSSGTGSAHYALISNWAVVGEVAGGLANPAVAPDGWEIDTMAHVRLRKV